MFINVFYINKIFRIISLILFILFISFLLISRTLWFRLYFYDTVYNAVISKSTIEYPKLNSRKYPTLTYVPFDSIGLGIKVPNLYYPSQIPDGEETLDKNNLSAFVRDYVTKIVPRSIDNSRVVCDDDYTVIKSVISNNRLKLLNKEFPEKPLCFYAGQINLKHLFTRSPFIDTIGEFITKENKNSIVDFMWLRNYKVQHGLVDLGCRIYVDENFEEYMIETTKNTYKKTDNEWNYAKKIVSCCLINVSTLKHHFTFSHHSIPNNIAIAAYKCLSPDHYLRRLLYPHIFKTLNTNRALGPTLFVENGVVENIFSYDSKTCWSILSDAQKSFDISMVDPMIYLNKITHSSTTKDCILGLYKIIHDYVEEYLRHYYQLDDETNTFIVQLKKYVWNVDYGLNDLIRIISIMIWTGSVRHSFISGNLWDYAAWVHYMPTRIYQDMRNMPIDRYQQAMNTLSVANIPSHELAHDYSYLALDGIGRNIMKKFRNSLLQHDEIYREKIRRNEIPKSEIVLAEEIGASTAT